MNKPHSQRGGKSGAKSPWPQKSTPNTHAPSFGKVTPKQDPKDTAQEAVHQVMPKQAANDLVATAAARRSEAPLQAAKGDDDLMSQPAKTS